MRRLIRSATASWRTTLLASLSFGVALLQALSAVVDGNDATAADWNLVVTTAMTAIGLLLAKDDDSE